VDAEFSAQGFHVRSGLYALKRGDDLFLGESLLHGHSFGPVGPC